MTRCLGRYAPSSDIAFPRGGRTVAKSSIGGDGTVDKVGLDRSDTSDGKDTLGDEALVFF